MLKFLTPAVAGAALLASAALPAVAADIYVPPVIDAPAEVIYKDVPFGGWYLRGDVGYKWSKMKGADYITYGVDGCCVPLPGTDSFDFTKLKGSFSFGGGVGYQVTNYLRTDLTVDYWGKAKFNGQTSNAFGASVDTSKFSALLLLANAYAELGTYKRITPYIGAGIGGAHVKWDDLRNQFGNVDDRHPGAKGMRFAYALMAGASYCITNNWHADLGYRFTNISGGRMFDYVDSSAGGPGAGPGFHKDIRTHEVRAGLRYQFGGGRGGDCGAKEVVYKDYQEPVPVYPIYK